ncbi:MAG: FeoB small GTPase domain-containing protein, partial [Bacteroidota bacterium]
MSENPKDPIEGGELQPSHFEKHRHARLSFLENEIEKPKIVLVGNPNVGKSLVFNHLSGLYVDVSNYPGTTVEIVKGSYRNYTVYDTPGIYGVSSLNDEERVARDIVLEADIIINIVDATHLERDLFLTQQLIDMGKKIIVVLNFMDEVKKHGIEINIDRLSHFLGVKVIPAVAIKKIGFDELQKAIAQASEGTQRQELHALLHSMLSMVGSQAEALLILEGDPYVAERHGVSPGHYQERVYIERRNRVNYIVNQVLVDRSTGMRLSGLLGRMALRPLTGIPMIAVALYFIYLFVGKLVAQDVVGFTENQVGKGLWEPWVRSVVGSITSWPAW